MKEQLCVYIYLSKTIHQPHYETINQSPTYGKKKQGKFLILQNEQHEF